MAWRASIATDAEQDLIAKVCARIMAENVKMFIVQEESERSWEKVIFFKQGTKHILKNNHLRLRLQCPCLQSGCAKHIMSGHLCAGLNDIFQSALVDVSAKDSWLVYITFYCEVLATYVDFLIEKHTSAS